MAALAKAAEFSGTRKDVALAGALTGFAASDPQQALRWLEGHDADVMLTAAVVQGISQVDTDEATRRTSVKVKILGQNVPTLR